MVPASSAHPHQVFSPEMPSPHPGLQFDEHISQGSGAVLPSPGSGPSSIPATPLPAGPLQTSEERAQVWPVSFRWRAPPSIGPLPLTAPGACSVPHWEWMEAGERGGVRSWGSTQLPWLGPAPSPEAAGARPCTHFGRHPLPVPARNRHLSAPSPALHWDQNKEMRPSATVIHSALSLEEWSFPQGHGGRRLSPSLPLLTRPSVGLAGLCERAL